MPHPRCVRPAISNYRFASPETLAEALKGHKGGKNQWWARCPCHNDINPSLSIRWGRNGETMAHCFAGCTKDELFAHFRTLGFTLRPLPPPKPKKPKHPVTVATSVALSVCTLSERKMLSLISAGGDATYNGFEMAGVRRTAIPGGIRSLEAVGLIGVKRSTFDPKRGRYDRNCYWTSQQWRNLEPARLSKEANQAARAVAKAIAAAARKGISAAAETEGKPEADTSVLRIRGV